MPSYYEKDAIQDLIPFLRNKYGIILDYKRAKIINTIVLITKGIYTDDKEFLKFWRPSLAYTNLDYANLRMNNPRDAVFNKHIIKYYNLLEPYNTFLLLTDLELYRIYYNNAAYSFIWVYKESEWQVYARYNTYGGKTGRYWA